MNEWLVRKLEDIASVDYGTRVTRKKDGGSQYPVYGGGGKTFRLDLWNREDCYIVSRFAMSEECVRYVSGRFFLNDSGLTVRTRNSQNLDQAFLDQYLLSQSKRIYSLSRGTAQRNLDVPAFRNIEIPLPPLDEQKRIVAKLDEVGEKTDSLCEEHLQKLVHLETLKFRFLEDQLTFSDTASQSVILGDLIKVKHGFAFKSEFFQTKGNAEILTPGHFFESGGFRPRVGKEKYYSGEFPEEFKLCGGDLVVVMTEQAPGLLGSPVVIPSDKKYLHNQRIGLIQPKGPIDLPFLACVFNLPRVRAQLASTATGTMVRHTSPSRIEALEVDIPVDIDVQSRVAGRLAHFSKMAGEFEKVSLDRVTLARKLSQRASTAAFAGEL